LGMLCGEQAPARAARNTAQIEALAVTRPDNADLDRVIPRRTLPESAAAQQVLGALASWPAPFDHPLEGGPPWFRPLQAPGARLSGSAVLGKLCTIEVGCRGTGQEHREGSVRRWRPAGASPDGSNGVARVLGGHDDDRVR